MRCARLAQYTLRRARVVAALLGRLATLPEAVVRIFYLCEVPVATNQGAFRCCQRLQMLQWFCIWGDRPLNTGAIRRSFPLTIPCMRVARALCLLSSLQIMM